MSDLWSRYGKWLRDNNTKTFNIELKEKLFRKYGICYSELIDQQLLDKNGLNVYIGSAGELFVYDFDAEEWYRCEDFSGNCISH